MELAEEFVQASSSHQWDCGMQMRLACKCGGIQVLTYTGQDLGSAATYHAVFLILSAILPLSPPQDIPLTVPALALHQQIKNWIVGQ